MEAAPDLEEVIHGYFLAAETGDREWARRHVSQHARRTDVQIHLATVSNCTQVQRQSNASGWSLMLKVNRRGPSSGEYQ